jgi:hypothetical protein
MDTRDLIRKLYDEGVDLEDLEKGLDAETREEFGRIVEAKSALDELPRRAPSPSSVDAVKEFAADASAARPKPSGMTLIFGSRTLQHFAAAAAVIAAVGLAYLTIQPPQMPPDAQVGVAGDVAPATPTVENEARSNVLGKSESRETSADRIAAAPQVEEQRSFLDKSEPARADDAIDSAIAPSLASGLAEEVSGESPVPGFPSDEVESFSWDDERDLQTFYWQVQALSERSPGDEWEEGVPLEGSFEAIEGAKRDPGWLEAKSEK